MPYAISLSLVLVAAICTGLGSALGKSILRRVDSDVLGMYRALVGLAVSLIIFVSVEEWRGVSGLPATYVAAMFISGVFFFLGSVFYLKAVQMGNLSLVSPVTQSYPFFVFVLAIVFLREQVTFVLVLGSVMVLGSLALLTVAPESSSRARVSGNLPIIGLSLSCALSTAAFIVIAKYVLQLVPPLTLSLAQMIICVTGFYIMVMRRGQDIRIDASKLGSIAVMGLMTYVGGNLAYYHALRDIPTVVAAPLLTTTMLFGSLFGIVFFKEVMTVRHLAGIALAFAGVVSISASLAGNRPLEEHGVSPLNMVGSGATGHGIDPNLKGAPDLRVDNDEVLEAGMVLATEPAITDDPDWEVTNAFFYLEQMTFS